MKRQSSRKTFKYIVLFFLCLVFIAFIFTGNAMAQTMSDWTVKFYNSTNLTNLVDTKTYKDLSFQWADGDGPENPVTHNKLVDNFSIRATATLSV
ncbi:MAG TPA: hypothetical protein PK467_21090, partial [Candidatus Wallbacteria bacterium]|nr:hypothetical protein [Candidatus Wallbacteria bacterium]